VEARCRRSECAVPRDACTPANAGCDIAMTSKRLKNPTYYFIDVDVKSRQLIGWGTETKDKVEVHLTTGYHRVFLTKGQYNKLERKLRER
jgi:hypothetical protein